MSGFDRKTYARLYAQKRYQERLAAKRLSSRTCPRRFGKHGVCGALLLSSSDGRGGLIVRCPACERFERGLCRYCPLPVNGTVRRARFCASHRTTETRRNLKRYVENNRAKICLRTKRRYRNNKAVRQQRNDYKRLWRKANPGKVKAQKRREALRQNPRVYEYQRDYRAAHGIIGHQGILEGRTCLGCPASVSGRTKKCAHCKEREMQAAVALLAPNSGRGKRNDLRQSA